MNSGKAANGETNFPKRKTTYVGGLTDSNRWDLFQARENDIFVCTPPKCGTTWTQAICAFLILDTNRLEGNLGEISPWIDNKRVPVDVCLGILEAQTHRRFIKTHTPLDGIPYFGNRVYLMVYRDPRDVYFSLRNHLFNMFDPPNFDIPHELASNPQESFRAWLEAPFEPGDGNHRSLEAFVNHFQSFWQFRHLPNFHFFHYLDMKKDLSAAIQRIADILQIQISTKRLEELCQAASFAEMKKNASSFVPTVSGKAVFKNEESFFISGKNNQWQDVLTPEDIQDYNRRINQLLSPEQTEWVEYGGRGVDS